MPEANKIQVGYIDPQDGVQFKVDEGTAAAPGVCFVDSTATGLYSPGTGQIAWSTSGKQTALRILADGKVGIDCSPTVALEVNGTIKASAIDAPIEGTLDDWIIHAGDTNTKFGFPANDTFTVETSGTERLRIKSDGHIEQTVGADNIGFDQVAASSHYITNVINANRSGAGDHILIQQGQWNGKDVAAIKFKVGADTTNKDDGVITFETSSANNQAERMRISSDGTVGIGQNSPDELLHIKSATSTAPLIEVEHNQGTAYKAQFGLRGNDLEIRGSGGNVEFYVGSNDGASSTERLRIRSDGRITTNGETGGDVAIGGIHIKTVANASTAACLILENHGTATNTAAQLKFVPSDASPVDRYNAITSLDVDGNNKFDMFFHTCPGGTPVERIRITNAGQVKIGDGTYNDNSSRLVVMDSNQEVLADNEAVYNNASKSFITVYNNYGSGSGQEAGINFVPAGNANGAIALYAKKTASYAGDLIMRFRTASGTSDERFRFTNAGGLQLNRQGHYLVTNSGKALYGIDIVGSPGNTNEYGGAISLGHNADGRSAIASVQGPGNDADVSGLAFFTHPSSTGSDNNVEKMRLDSDGRILLGTTTEGHGDADNLTINDTRAGITLRSANDNYGNIFFSDATSGNAEYAGYVQYSHISNHLLFGTNATDRLWLDSSGNLSLGTSTSIQKFTIDGGGISLDNGWNTQWGVNASRAYIQGEDANGNNRLILGTNNGERLRITSGGKIGVNYAATPPGETLHISESSGASPGAVTVSHLSGGNRYGGRIRSISGTKQGMSISSVFNSTYTYGGTIQAPTSDTLLLQTEDKDAAYITNTQVFAAAKMAPMVQRFSPVTTRHWNNASVTRFYMDFYTGASSATYHVCRMISQTDWGFDNIEMKVAQYQYSYQQNDLFSRRFRTYYGGHINELVNYNQLGSGSGTGSMGCLDWRQDLGPSGAHQIHAQANGGYYRDCWGSDVYISLGVYEGFRIEVTVWANVGIYDIGDYANAQAFYPAAFQGQATQSAADSWGGPRGVWFNTTHNGTGTGSSPGCLDFSTGTTFGQTSTT